MNLSSNVPTTLEGFEEWSFSSGSSIGPDFKRFISLYRSWVKKEVKKIAADSVTIKSGHYDMHGFIGRRGRYVYWSTGDVRFSRGRWHTNILIRTAKDDKDFTGGRNTFATIKNFASKVDTLLQ